MVVEEAGSGQNEDLGGVELGFCASASRMRVPFNFSESEMVSVEWGRGPDRGTTRLAHGTALGRLQFTFSARAFVVCAFTPAPRL